MEEKKLAILGLRGSGKSTFMAVLNLAMSDAENPTKWNITAFDRETNRLIYEFENRILNEGLYPVSTTEKVMMQFRANKNAELGGLIPGGDFKIIAGDVPGEAIKGGTSEFARFHDFYQENVAGSSAIIFLLDPHEAWKEKEGESFNYFPLFRNILTELKQQAPDVYLAFGVTKIDALPKDIPSENIVNNIYKYGQSQDVTVAEQLAEFVLGKQTKGWIEKNFNQGNLSWWLISATGFIIDNKSNVSSQFIEKQTENGLQPGIKEPNNIKPIGVVEIVEWALRKIAREAENGRDSFTGKAGKWLENLF